MINSNVFLIREVALLYCAIMAGMRLFDYSPAFHEIQMREKKVGKPPLLAGAIATKLKVYYFKEELGNQRREYRAVAGNKESEAEQFNSQSEQWEGSYDEKMN